MLSVDNNRGSWMNPGMLLELTVHSRLFIILRCPAKLDRNLVHDKKIY